MKAEKNNDLTLEEQTETTEEPKKESNSLIEAEQFIRSTMMKASTLDGKTYSSELEHEILSKAMGREPKAIDQAKELILETINDNKISVEGYSTKELAERIFANVWGLSVIEEYASDYETDEIRVNSYNKIYIVKNGIPQKLDISFPSEDEVEILIKRVVMEDTGVSIDMSNPRIESVLGDGSRLTAVAPPISKNWSFILRRHCSFNPTVDNYLKKETFDEKTWKALSLLVRGRASMLYSGNVGAGKTTLMRKLIGELNDKLRIASIGKDIEVLIQNLYPDKDVIELEEQAHLGIGMKELFITLLRESPDAIVVEEFRGGGEAIEAVRACTRGLDGSMATAHFNTPEEAVEGTALFMLEEGLAIPMDMAKLRVARAFNIVVQMTGDAITGKKKLVSITELTTDEQGQVNFNELLRWKPSSYNYYGEGDWEFVGKPSKGLQFKLLKNVRKEELEEMGWL